ncbi:DUF3000 family protein [Bifidobacterium psychraerophilum]|uniref:DUF3000 family protein n=1 Tax=Bifidobacterium psychraerophilum TaxID=218140 RepID=UPI0031134E2F
MAEIFTLPERGDTVSAPDGKHAAHALLRPGNVPDDMWYAVESVHRMRRLEGVEYREIQVPTAMADFGIGIELSCEGGTGASSQQPSAWIMVLYARTPRLDWGSRWRCVAFMSVAIERAERDCLTASMFLDDLSDHLSDVVPDSVGGTVTLTENRSFGAIGQEESSGCEMRVSWTPADVGPAGLEAGLHVSMWAQYLLDVARQGDNAELSPSHFSQVGEPNIRE